MVFSFKQKTCKLVKKLNDYPNTLLLPKPMTRN